MNDFRYALRSLRASPGFTTAAVLTLALGLGATTAIYALVERIVLDPLPYADADRMVQLTSAVPGVAPDEEWNLSAAQYLFLSQRATSLEAAGAYQIWSANVQGMEGPVRATLAQLTASTLRLVGAAASIGRLFTDDEDRPGALAVVLLSHAFWRREFGADSGIVGRSLMVDESPMEIIGVLAPDVELPTGASQVSDPEINASKPDLGTQPGLWVPMALNPAGPFYNDHGIPVIARLRAHVSLERAQAEIDALTSRLPDAFPRVYSTSFMERTGFRTRLHLLKAYVIGDLAKNLWILFGGVGLVLLIAAANVANLVLVRAEGRHREIAIRAALGAGRLTLARQAFAETLVLAGLGGSVALIAGSWSVQWLTWAAPPGIPRLGHVKLDGGVYLFTLAVSVVVALVLAVFAGRDHRAGGGIAAGIEGSRTLTAGRERQRVRGGLVALQMALALVLVVAAGLLIESLRRLKATDPGIDPRGVLTVRVTLPPARYSELPAQWRFYDAVRDRIEGLPGVTSAGFSLSLPFTGTYGCTVHGFEDAAVLDRMRAAGGLWCGALTPTSPGYFEALGIPVVAGRSFTQADNDQPGTGAAIVSRAFAHRFWPGEDPIGKGVRPFNSGTAYYRVVGVVGDVPATGLDAPPALAIYYPIVAVPGQPRWWPSTMFMVVRIARGDPTSLLAAIRRSVAEVDPTIPLANAEEMRTIVDRSMARLSFTMVLLGAAATVALTLAALGLYGVVSYVVALRTNEIGVRMALGARPADVQRLVVGGSLVLALLGLGAGTLGALALTRVLRGLLYGVQPTNPLAYLAAAAILGAVAALAAYLPARRAARVDPLVALRYE